MVRLLEGGTTLVVDRYAFSGVAFSAAKVLRRRSDAARAPRPSSPQPLVCTFLSLKGLDLGWCRAPDVGLPEPDAVIYLHLSVDEAAKRGDYGAERYEKRDFQEKVQKEFDRLREPSWHVIDARQTVAELHDAIAKLALATVAASADKPLRPLWSS